MEYIPTWSAAMTNSVQKAAASGVAYRYFVTDYGYNPNIQITAHTSLPAPLFYRIEQDGVLLRDWLKQSVFYENGTSFGGEFIKQVNIIH